MLENEGATPEVEEVEEKSMDDTIRETLNSLKERGAELPEETPEAPEEKAARLRDESGKFKAKEDAPVVENTTPETPEWTPPNTWKKEAAAKLKDADPEIRAEVARREADIHKGIEQYRERASFGDSMARAFAPHMDTLKSIGVSPDHAVSVLLGADRALRYGSPEQKLQTLVGLAHDYKIDLSGAFDQVQNFNPQLHELRQQNATLMQQLQQQNQMREQQANESLYSDVEAFRADPSHSHFDAVRGHMAALLQAGQAKDLQDAYEQAVYANPTTRALVLAEQQAKQREEAAQKAQAAKVASSVNVRSRPAMPTSTPIGTMDETIRATLRRLQSA